MSCWCHDPDMKSVTRRKKENNESGKGQIESGGDVAVSVYKCVKVIRGHFYFQIRLQALSGAKCYTYTACYNS